MAAPTILTTEQILDAAKLAGGYAILDREKNNKLFGGMPEQKLPEKIHFVEGRIQKVFDHNSSDSTLRLTSNFLWTLLGKYGLRAVNSLDPSGTTIVQASQSGQLITIAYRYIQFVVGDSSSVQPSGFLGMNDGDVLYVVPFPTATDSESIFRQSISLPRAPISDSNYTITYGTSTTSILFSNPVSDFELIQMHLWENLTPGIGGAGLQYVSVTVVTTASTLVVSEISGKSFVLASTGAQTFDDTYVIQTGTTLDFSAVGGVTAGQQITIFFS